MASRKGLWSTTEDEHLVEAVKRSRITPQVPSAAAGSGSENGNLVQNRNPNSTTVQNDSNTEARQISWEKVAGFFGGSRTSAQCRQRYLNYLSPFIRTEEWTEEEDAALFNLFEKYGSKWSQIRKHELLRGRTVFAIRGRFRILLKKRELSNLQVSIDDESSCSSSTPKKRKSQVLSVKSHSSVAPSGSVSPIGSPMPVEILNTEEVLFRKKVSNVMQQFCARQKSLLIPMSQQEAESIVEATEGILMLRNNGMIPKITSNSVPLQQPQLPRNGISNQISTVTQQLAQFQMMLKQMGIFL